MKTVAPEASYPVESGTLSDTSPEPELDRITVLAATLLRVPVARLWLVDDKHQFFKSMTGCAAEGRETPLSHSFCQHVVARRKAVVEVARLHPLVRENKAVEDLGVIACLG